MNQVTPKKIEPITRKSEKDIKKLETPKKGQNQSQIKIETTAGSEGKYEPKKG